MKLKSLTDKSANGTEVWKNRKIGGFWAYDHGVTIAVLDLL